MTDLAPPVNPGSVAPIRNVAACSVLLETLISCPDHVPNIGVYSGYSGYGKTMAAIYCRNAADAVMIEVFDSWTRRKFCSAILKELGVVTPRGTVSTMMDEIVERFGADPKPLIIDEAHTAVARGFVELIREINKLSRAPILLVGEEMLPKSLERYENTDNLVLDYVLAEPCDLADTRVLARLYFPKLTLADDLLEHFRQRTGGRARRIVSTLHAAATYAVNNGLTALDLASYDGQVYSGAKPARLGRVA